MSEDNSAGRQSLASVLKQEVTRLAKKAVREAIEPVLKTSASRRQDVADLKRRVKDLEVELKKLQKQLGATKEKAPAPNETGEAAQEQGQLRFRRDGFISLRKRLGFSARQMGLLVGVSQQTIYNWEEGASAPQQAQLQKIAAIRKINKRDALAKIGETSE